jgi:hypothetical protein
MYCSIVSRLSWSHASQTAASRNGAVWPPSVTTAIETRSRFRDVYRFKITPGSALRGKMTPPRGRMDPRECSATELEFQVQGLS